MPWRRTALNAGGLKWSEGDLTGRFGAFGRSIGFGMAWAIISPMSRSPLAEIVPTWAISSFVETFSSTTASTARSMPRFRKSRAVEKPAERVVNVYELGP